MGLAPQSLRVPSGMTVERGQGDQTRRDQPIEAGQLCNRLEIFLAPNRPPRTEREQHRRGPGSPDSKITAKASESSSPRPKASGISRAFPSPLGGSPEA